MFATVIIRCVLSQISHLIIWGCSNGDNYWDAHWKTQFSLTQWAILGCVFFRIGGKSHQRKHRRQLRSPPGQPSPPPVTLQSNATAASGTIRKEITDRTGKQLRSLHAKNKSWTATRHSEWKDDPNSPPPKLTHLYSVPQLIFCSKRCREDGVSKAGSVKTTQSKHRTNDSERKRKR